MAAAAQQDRQTRRRSCANKCNQKYVYKTKRQKDKKTKRQKDKKTKRQMCESREKGK
jgi:hypothetical protein